MMVKEFNLSEKRMEIHSVNGTFEKAHYSEENIKEFIKISEARISNQLRIHWNWLKKKSPEEVAEFVNNIITKRAGDKLI